MSIMERLLKNKIYEFLKYKILSEESDDKIFAQLAESNLVQAKNIFKNLSEIEVDSILESKKEKIENFYRENESKVKENSDKKREKLFIHSKEITKMEYMLLKNYTQNKKMKNLYICRDCGWVGKDEIVDKCPLCTNTSIKEI